MFVTCLTMMIIGMVVITFVLTVRTKTFLLLMTITMMMMI